MEQTSPIQALLQQRTLLQIEYYTEKEAFRKQTEQMGMQRKVKRGDAWFPLRIGKSFYNSLNQNAIEVFRTEDQDIEHNFEFGRPVMFFKAGKTKSAQTDGKTEKKMLKYFSFTGTVSYVDGDRMVITVPDSAPLLELQQADVPVGVQLSFDETSYKMMFDALDRTMKAKNNRLAYLRDLFYSHRKAERYSFEPMRFPWLNPTQEQAVNEVLWAKDVAIVHGPPGTGKTTTLVEAINETLMRESQVLVCAQSNMAVDWISEKLVDRGINVLRIGNPTRVNDKMLGFTYERRFESHPDYPQLWAIRKAIRELRKNRKKGSENFHQKMDRLKSRAAEIEIRINAELMGEARVIACTLVGSSHRLLEGMKFGTLLHRRGSSGLRGSLLDSDEKSRQSSAGGRPLSVAAYGEEHRRHESRTGQDTDGAHRREQTRGGDAAEDTIPHERGNHAILERLVLPWQGAECATDKIPEHPGLRPRHHMDRHRRHGESDNHRGG